MKKRILTFILLIGLAISFSSNFAPASTAAQTHDPDNIFVQSLSYMTEAQEVSFERSGLYSPDFTAVGFYYFFETSEENGYAFVLGDYNNGFVLEEVYFADTNPIAEGNIPIYIAPGAFYEYDGNNFIDAITGQIILADIGYSLTVPLTNTVDTFNFERATSTSYKIGIEVPFYSETSYLNSCANIAGSIIIGYYDRIFPELIPNFDAWDYSTNKFARDNAQVRYVADLLYFDMNTNTHNGTSYLQFLAGLNTYVQRHGRSPYFQNMLSSVGVIDYTALRNAIDSNLPVVCFFSGFNAIFEYYRTATTDLYLIGTNTGRHTMIAYGYEEFNYYRHETRKVWSPVWYNPFRYVEVTEEVNFRIDEYLLVSTCIGGGEKAIMRLKHNNSVLEHAVSVALS